MRLVVFGGSIDDSSVGEPCGLSIQLIQAALTAHLGKRVEARYVRLFPAANLPQRVGRTVEALDPDAVILHCSGAHVGVYSRPFHQVPGYESLREYLRT